MKLCRELLLLIVSAAALQASHIVASFPGVIGPPIADGCEAPGPCVILDGPLGREYHHGVRDYRAVSEPLYFGNKVAFIVVGEFTNIYGHVIEYGRGPGHYYYSPPTVVDINPRDFELSWLPSPWRTAGTLMAAINFTSFDASGLRGYTTYHLEVTNCEYDAPVCHDFRLDGIYLDIPNIWDSDTGQLVPEPSTYALVGLGLAGLALRRRLANK